MASGKQEYGSIPAYEPHSTGSNASVEPTLKNALIAEIFGTLVLVQVGCGGLCVDTYLSGLVCACCVV